MKKGRAYYYVRESTSIEGKTKIINQVYLGTPERIMQMAMAQGGTEILKLKTQEYGSVWLAEQLCKEVGLAELVDAVASKGPKKAGPTLGEYFLYAVINRMVDPRSKRALPEWYEGTAIQRIRPVELSALDSRGYWKKWENVEESNIRAMAKSFFERVAEIEEGGRDCLLFDTTNFYTYLSDNTDSELAARGKNKDGKNWLRQVGVALLVSRKTRLPLFYQEYEGNRHDSKVFFRLMEEILSSNPEGELTVVFDKGMNSEENITAIDQRAGVHFITTYSPYFAQDLIHVDQSKFQVVDTLKNKKLAEAGKEDDLLTAWRTTRELWGRERTVVVTYNPLTATKQRHRFEDKMLRLQSGLFELRSWGKNGRGATKGKVLKKYGELCESLYLPSNLYDLDFGKSEKGVAMSFRKNAYRISRHIDRFGKNILVTDRVDWSTDEIVGASLDRYIVEKAFRDAKDSELVRVHPMYHWTDGKIRCHLLVCAMALTLLRLLELRLHRAGVSLSAKAAMRKMRRLNSCLCFFADKRKPGRMIEEPSEDQANILGAFGQRICRGVLQEKSV
jgi:transposase